MARIPYFDPEIASPDIRQALNGRRQINVFKLIGQSDNAAAEVFNLGFKMSKGSSLDPVLREVVILRVAALTKAKYQAHEHRAVALRHGFSPRKIDAVANFPLGDEREELTLFEEQLIGFVDSVVSTSTAPDRLFDPMYEHFGDSQIVELVLIIGFYMMIGRVMNTFEIELETGAVPTFEFKSDQLPS